MEQNYDGLSITARLSPARPGEAAHRGMSVEEANATLRTYYQAQLERKYPGASVTVEMEGDRPSATAEGLEDLQQARLIQYDAERIGLAVKWAFSTLGEGLPAAG